MCVHTYVCVLCVERDGFTIKKDPDGCCCLSLNFFVMVLSVGDEFYLLCKLNWVSDISGT